MSNKSIDEDFNLALKFFINKNFSKSFQIICSLYLKGFDEFQNGHITERTFTKIVNLYLVEVGLLLKNNDGILISSDLEKIVEDCRNDRIFNYLERAYGNQESIPFEVLYNISLIYNLNSTRISDDPSWLLIRFEKIYLLGQNDYNDVFVQRIMELYVYEVLPKLKKTDISTRIIKSDPYFEMNIEEALNKLERVKKTIVKNEKLEMERKKEKEALEKALLEKSIQKKKELKLKNDLKYQSRKNIQQSYLNSSSESALSKEPIHSKQRLFHRIQAIFNLVKNYTKENYQAVFVISLALLVCTAFLRRKKINLTEKLRETLKMAFKISYL